jgi:IS1 family transposase
MSLPELSETLVEPAPPAPALELDELWSFVLRRANKRWLWIALCRATRQVVAYVVGDRSAATCRKLRGRIPAAYRSAHCYTDFWEA